MIYEKPFATEDSASVVGASAPYNHGLPLAGLVEWLVVPPEGQGEGVFYPQLFPSFNVQHARSGQRFRSQ
jgi:hypothetical protein